MLKDYINIIALFLSLSMFNTDIYRKYDSVSMNQISSMIVQVAPSNGKVKEVVLTKDKNFSEIWTFVKLFNSAKPYADDRDTTHPSHICLNLNSGEKIEVWGGCEDFQEIQEEGNNYIFKSVGLSVYFKYLCLRYKP